ncbi:hypothetical protein ACWEGE_17010 [Amycolatopsis sp. NPDC004747]
MGVLSVTPAAAQAPSQGTGDAVQESTYVVSAPAPESISVATGSHLESVDYWRYYSTGN